MRPRSFGHGFITMGAFAILFHSEAHGLPVDNNSVLPMNHAGETGLLWASIALAVFTALIQGLVTTMALVAEDASMWTFRFRIARYEHWWWTVVSALLAISLILMTLSFLVGNNGEAVSILALSTATGIAIVRYAVPSWRSRKFIENRWLAWTGDSRTGIARDDAKMCGDSAHWKKLSRKVGSSEKLVVPSDEWGWTWRSPEGLAADATAILDNVSATHAQDTKYNNSRNGILGVQVYHDGLNDTGRVSLLWGSEQNFRKRVSRGVGSMPLNLLRSVPLTIDNYVGEGLCLAMGVLGRNKGLDPKTLVYGPKERTEDELKDKSLPPQIPAGKIHGALEASSTWKPRPSKVLRGYYYKTMHEQYGTLGASYVAAAIELALIFADSSSEAIQAWFGARLEQQSWELNEDLQSLREELGNGNGPNANEMNALYRATYVSMVLSLNYITIPDRSPRTGPPAKHQRPDLHCMALLMMAERMAKPRWWDNPRVAERLEKEENGLTGRDIAPWKQPMAWLLELREFPRCVKSWDVGNAVQPVNSP